LETQNLAFFGTLANEGDAVGLVIRTGDNTTIGKIAGLAANTKSVVRYYSIFFLVDIYIHRFLFLQILSPFDRNID
jgi:magnesium-transporting ATPase (P-type)